MVFFSAKRHEYYQKGAPFIPAYTGGMDIKNSKGMVRQQEVKPQSINKPSDTRKLLQKLSDLEKYTGKLFLNKPLPDSQQQHAQVTLLSKNITSIILKGDLSKQECSSISAAIKKVHTTWTDKPKTISNSTEAALLIAAFREGFLQEFKLSGNMNNPKDIKSALNNIIGIHPQIAQSIIDIADSSTEAENKLPTPEDIAKQYGNDTEAAKSAIAEYRTAYEALQTSGKTLLSAARAVIEICKEKGIPLRVPETLARALKTFEEQLAQEKHLPSGDQATNQDQRGGKEGAYRVKKDGVDPKKDKGAVIRKKDEADENIALKEDAKLSLDQKVVLDSGRVQVNRANTGTFMPSGTPRKAPVTTGQDIATMILSFRSSISSAVEGKAQDLDPTGSQPKKIEKELSA